MCSDANKSLFSGEVSVYCHVTCDVFHAGHAEFLRKARALGSRLLVGLSSDEEVASYKRPPLFSLEQRAIVLRACRYVDEVLINVPVYTSYEWISRYEIGIVAASKEYTPEEIESFYRDPRDLGILKFIERMPEISSTDALKKAQEMEWSKGNESRSLTLLPDRFSCRWKTKSRKLSEQFYGSGFQSPANDRILPIFAEKLQLTTSKRLLDVGCATGGSSFYFAKQFGAEVTAIDRSVEQIDECIDRLSPGSGVIHFEQADLQEFCSSHHSEFDCIWMRDVFMYFSDKANTLDLLSRLLKQDGTLALLDFALGEGEPPRSLQNYLYHNRMYIPGLREYTEIFAAAGYHVRETVDLTSICATGVSTELQTFEQRQGEEASFSDVSELLTRQQEKVCFFQNRQLLVVGFLLELA